MQIFDSRGQLKESVARFFRAKGSAPRLILEDVNADADERLWDWQASNGQLALRTRTDADESGASPIVISRQGTTVTAISLAAGALTFNGTPLVLQSRQIIAGTGLTGGGDLSADRTISLSASTISAVNLAMSAVQPGDLANVAFSGDYADLLNTPTIPPDLSALQFLTAVDESTALPNSRRLVAGSNITFDTSTPGQLTIHATGSGGGGAVNAVIGGTGISVDNTDPTEPVVSLSADSQAALALATTAVQPEDLALVAFSGEYSDLSGIPSTFAPSAHSHGDEDITGLSWAKLSGVPVYATRWPSWDEVTGKPSSFTPVAHTHNAADIVSGILSKSLIRSVNVVDTRDVNDPVSNFSSNVQFDFKYQTTVSLPGGGPHAVLMTVSPWHDDTGGPTHQLAFEQSGRLYHRTGTRADGWNSWAPLLEGWINRWIEDVAGISRFYFGIPTSFYAAPATGGSVAHEWRNGDNIGILQLNADGLLYIKNWAKFDPEFGVAYQGGARLWTGPSDFRWFMRSAQSGLASLVLQDVDGVNRVWLHGDGGSFGFIDGDGVWSIRFSSGHRILNNNGNFPYGTYQIFGAVNGYTGLILNDGAHYPTFMSDSSWIGVYCQFGGREWLWADDGAGILLRGKVRQYGSGRAYLLSNYDSANVTISTSAPSGGSDGDIWLQVL